MNPRPDSAAFLPTEAFAALSPEALARVAASPPVLEPATRQQSSTGDSHDAPQVAPPPPPVATSVRPPRRIGLIAAVVLSVAAHAALVGFLADKIRREGMEAATDAVSVSIILDAPPLKAAEPLAGSAVASDEAEALSAVADAQIAEAAAASERPRPVEVERARPVEIARAASGPQPAEPAKVADDAAAAAAPPPPPRVRPAPPRPATDTAVTERLQPSDEHPTTPRQPQTAAAPSVPPQDLSATEATRATVPPATTIQASPAGTVEVPLAPTPESLNAAVADAELPGRPQPERAAQTQPQPRPALRPQPESLSAASGAAHVTPAAHAAISAAADAPARIAAQELQVTVPFDAASVAELASPTGIAAPGPEMPLPTPRPDYQPAPQPEPAEESQTPPPQRAAETRPRPAPAHDRASEPGRTAGGAQDSSAASSAGGRQGGATAGEVASYKRKLLSHVQRHKRYPPAVRDAHLTGATKLAITIDRAGGFVGVRVVSSSGQGVIDDAARDVARAAAPYPAPPDGVGGRTVTFSVTLRYSR